ncbi:hypothetical protein KEM48_009145 [Puccinia striiformis f. sp. tritici PST-130]|nr:hypothetical protein KEM48_009145 [Puccinia striiformis f. sp. tritici PST-130]
MELLIELYWSLAETLFILRNYSDAREALEQICDPEKILCLTASHKLFKRLLRLHWELKNIGANGILEDSEKIGRGGFSEIWAAYRKLVFIHHPDRNGST